MLANNYQVYQQNAVLTASPQELTLMLYNGAIKFCNLGKEMIAAKNVEKSNYYIQRVQAIMSELQITLDDNYPITKDIRPLYAYISNLLVEANITKDEKKLSEAKDLIVDFRDMWKEVMKTAK